MGRDITLTYPRRHSPEREPTGRQHGVTPPAVPPPQHTRVDPQAAHGQGGQLSLGGNHDHVLHTDSPDHRRTQLLVAPAEDVALAADDGHHDGGLLPRREKGEQLGLGDVAGDRPAVTICVYPE
jgi:hypothetical protein